MNTTDQASTPMTDTTTPPTRVEQGEELPYPSCQVPSARVRQTAGDKVPQPRRWRANVTWAILAVNLLVWVLDASSGPVLGLLTGTARPHLLLELGAKRGDLIVLGETWRLITPIFLHVGLLHLAFNSYAIYMIGPQIECFFGPHRFASIYLLSGVYGVLFSFAFSPAPSAGASGAIFGLIGTQAAFFYRYRNAFGDRGRRQLYSTVLVIAFNMVLTLTAPGIDIWGHIGGLIAGAFLGWNLTPQYVLMRSEAGGVMLIDRNHAGRWGRAVLGAIALLIASTWLTVVLQAAGA
jgi:rhomboid protease GluP